MSKQELENIVKRESKLTRIVTLPVKPLSDVCNDVYSAISSINTKKDWLKFGTALAICAPIFTLTHEGLHALVAKMCGAYNFEMGINPIIGGDLVQKILPFVRTDPEFIKEFYGAVSYTIRPADNTPFNEAIISYAPYTMTFLGVYLLHQGVKKKSLILKALGVASIINLVHNTLAYNGDISKITENVIEGTGMLFDNLKIGMNLLIASATYEISTRMSQAINYLTRGKQK